MSAIVTIVGRIGRDVVIRYTPKNTAVANIAIAADYGYGENKGTQWWDISLFGNQATSLEPYLKKGAVLQITAKDPHISEYEHHGEKGTKLTAIAIDVSFVPKQSEQTENKPAPKPQPKPAPSGGDLADDIPFMRLSSKIY